MYATVKTFRAPDAVSALAAAKAALGPEAVILSTREVTGGLFRGREIEITAALPAAPERRPPRQNPYTAAAAASSFGSAASQASFGAAPAAYGAAAAPAIPPSRADEPDYLSLQRAMKDARREAEVLSLRPRFEPALTPAASELYSKLLHNGVEDALAEELIRQALFDGAQGRPRPLAESVADMIACRLVPARAPWLPDQKRAVAFVGPTGVGKTTTLAKIAARAMLDSGLKVALVTIDTYRIGASEQVARYGAIMGVPTYVARDRNELLRSLERCANADLVLIDTAGRALSEAVARQAEMLRTVPGVALHLVLSAATGFRQLSAIADRYRALAPERLIFSKVDEAVAPGAVLSAAVRVNRPVACIADGQRVPEDLQPATSDALVTLVLGASEIPQAGTARRQ